MFKTKAKFDFSYNYLIWKVYVRLFSSLPACIVTLKCICYISCWRCNIIDEKMSFRPHHFKLLGFQFSSCKAPQSYVYGLCVFVLCCALPCYKPIPPIISRANHCQWGDYEIALDANQPKITKKSVSSKTICLCPFDCRTRWSPIIKPSLCWLRPHILVRGKYI